MTLSKALLLYLFLRPVHNVSVLIAAASSEDPDEYVHMRLARAFADRIYVVHVYKKAQTELLTRQSRLQQTTSDISQFSKNNKV